MELEPPHTESTCVIVTAAGSDDVHLALVTAGAARPAATLCDREVVPTPPTRHFQDAGCCACARVSLERGIDCARETAQVAVNLRRFYDWASRTEKQAEGLGPAAAVVPA